MRLPSGKASVPTYLPFIFMSPLRAPNLPAASPKIRREGVWVVSLGTSATLFGHSAHPILDPSGDIRLTLTFPSSCPPATAHFLCLKLQMVAAHDLTT